MSPWQLVLVVAVVLVAFYLKGILGLGGPLLIIPILAGFTGLEFAVAVVAIPNLIANTILVWQTRDALGDIRWFIWPFLLAGCAGAAVGTWLLVSYDDRWASLTLGIVVLAYIGWSLARPDFRLSHEWARWSSAPVGLVGGVFQGGTGVSGPVNATYLHALGLARDSFMLALTLPFLVLTVIQVITLAALGAYDRERLVAAAVAILPMLIGIRGGMRLGGRISRERFDYLVLIVLAIAAIRLIWSVL